ncbi:MAG: hypothetical protein PF636_08890, partial [Actinomycetota bacterium]|nr:hypothetical protein [Actinomycetota bacterium]
LEWCVLCCSHRKWLDPKTGWCEICTTKLRTEKQRIEADEEEERLREEAERENGMARKERQRMREEFDANPRKGLDA